MKIYKARIFPGIFLYQFLEFLMAISISIFVMGMISFAIGLYDTEKFFYSFECGLEFISVRGICYLVSRLIRRRLLVSMWDDHIEIFYVPQFHIQKERIVILYFKDMLVCKEVTQKGKGRGAVSFLNIEMKNGLRYRFLGRMTAFEKIYDFSCVFCEQDISDQFKEFKIAQSV